MKLKAYIESHSSQGDFADAIGVTIQAISQYCRGVRRPRPDIAQKIIKATNGAVTFEDLFFPATTPPEGEEGE